jgi:hypothetical protein
MTNRKNLHDYGLVLILLGVLNLFNFLSTVISGWINGTISNELATVEADILVAVKAVLIIFAVIMGLLAFADAFVGFKALKVSAKPTADKGYITVAKVFFIINVIGFVFSFAGLFDGAGDIIDKILSTANLALSAVAYIYFIKAAQAVRQDVLNGVTE